MPSEPQRRAAAILAFRDELARLETEGVVALPSEVRERIRAHHDQALAALVASGDVDLSARAARLSAGMRVATLLGTVALAAAYAVFVSSHWGDQALAAQLALVAVPPVLLALLTHVAARREPSGYVASLLGTVGAIALAVNLGTLGALYNLADSRTVLLVVGTFALLLAYGYGLVLPLLVGALGVGGWLWTLGAVPAGLWWRDGFGTMEPLVLTGLLAFSVPWWTRGPARFAPWWRGIGVTAAIAGLLMGSSNGTLTLLPVADPHLVALGYQVVGTIGIAGFLAWGIRHEAAIVTRIAVLGAILFLFLRLVDWFWDWLPQWAFFLLVGGFALGVLFLLRRLRRATA